MEAFAVMTEIRMSKNPNTKTTYIEEVKKTETISREQYNNTINSCSFFRRLGGSETLTRAYTSRGYLPIQLTSISPDRQTKVIRTFKFND